MSDPGPSNLAVLIAEDYPDIAELVGDLLREEGYVVTAVSRGGEVVAAVRQTRPALVLLDLSLPDVPGNEILRQLAMSPETSQVPIIVVSAYTEQLRRVPQVRAVVNKPFDITTLLEAVAEVRQNGQART